MPTLTSPLAPATAVVNYSTYHGIRQHRVWLVVAKGHKRKGETVVDRHADYLIVTEASESARPISLDDL